MKVLCLILAFLTLSCVSENQEYLVFCSSWENRSVGMTMSGSYGFRRGYLSDEPEGVWLYDPYNRRTFMSPYCRVLNLDSPWPGMWISMGRQEMEKW